MKLSSTEPGLVLSSSAHAALLVAALVGFWSPKPFEDVSEAVPVEVISEAELRRITQGQRDAQKVEPKPAPAALRTATAPEAKPELPPAKPEPPAPPAPPPRPAETKSEPPTEAKAEPPPPPPPRPAEPAPEPPPRPPLRSAAAPEPKPEPPRPADVTPPEPPKDAEVVKPAPPKPAEAKKPEPKPKPVEKPKAAAKPAPKPADDEEEDEKPKPTPKPAAKPAPKPDEIAKLIEPTPAAKPAPATPAPAPVKPAPAAPPAKAFDRSDIEKVLRGAGQPPGGSPGPAAQQPQRAASLGAPAGRADKLTPSDRDALIGIVSEQLRRCWSLPPGTSPAYKPALAFAVTEDGVVTGAPTVTNPRSEAPFQATAASAVRAVQRCSRLNIPARFKPFHRDWAKMVITFDPSDVF